MKDSIQLITAHVMLDCSVVPQNRKNQRNRGMRDILAGHFGNLFIYASGPQSDRSFEHHSRLLGGIF